MKNAENPCSCTHTHTHTHTQVILNNRRIGGEF